MNDYLTGYTVKLLKGIARNMGLKGVSTLRKAELIEVVRFAIERDHEIALMANETFKPFRAMVTKVSLIDYPVPYGRPVTEAHAKICRDRGCVTYVNNGMDMGYCPRCGNVTTSEEQITEEEIMETDPITESAKYVDEITAFLTTRFVKVRQARESLPEDSADFDGIVQIENDLRRAMGEFERTLSYIRTSGEDDSHTCDLNLREVGLSGCSYGCKIYRCQSCGTDREIHNATYGCRS